MGGLKVSLLASTVRASSARSIIKRAGFSIDALSMLSRNVCMTAQVAVVFAPSLLAQLVGDPVWDYCSGKGSICEASTDMLNECSEKDGEEYYKCICTSGYIPTDKQ